MQPKEIMGQEVTATFSVEELEWLGRAASAQLNLELYFSTDRDEGSNKDLKWKRELTTSLMNLGDGTDIDSSLEIGKLASVDDLTVEELQNLREQAKGQKLTDARDELTPEQWEEMRQNARKIPGGEAQ